MLYTKEWVAQKYEYYNNLIFGGKLPDFSTVNFKITNVKNPWGQGGCERWVKVMNGFGGTTYEPRVPYLRLSNYYDTVEDDKINVLVHEMVHIYEYFVENKYVINAITYKRYSRDTYPKDGHGYVFFKMAKMINDNFGIDIRRFVSKEIHDNAKIAGRRGEILKQKTEKGIPFVVLKYLKMQRVHGRMYEFGYAKISDNQLDRWVNVVTTSSYYPKNIEYVKLYISHNIEINKLPTNRPGHWYMSNINGIDDMIDKYQLEYQKTLFSQTGDDGEEENEIVPSGSIPLFKLSTTNGKTIELKNTTYDRIRDAIKSNMPNLSDTAIVNLMNNDRFYPKGKGDTMNENRTTMEDLKEAIKESIKKYLNKEDDGLPDVLPGTIVDN